MTATQTKPPVPTNGSALATERAGAVTEVEKQRAIAETVAAIEVARRFPRDVIASIDRIVQACTRPSLAESALYSYARGGTEITGPSIRLAEAIAQNYGNIQFGVRELEQRHGESSVEAFAWDVETNTRSSVTFQVLHKRVTRERSYDLTDPRDIYEMVANQGARRLRSRILAVVPGDIVEIAVNQVETTLKTRVKITPELLQSLLEKFGELGVTKQMLEARIQRNFDAITPALVVQIGKWYNSIKDGIGSVTDYFQVEQAPEQGASPADKIKEQLRKVRGPAEQSGAAEAPAAGEANDDRAQQLERDRAEANGRTELRNKIAEVWKGIKPAQRSVILARHYGKQTLLDLNVAQLEQLLEKLPEILEGAQG